MTYNISTFDYDKFREFAMPKLGPLRKMQVKVDEQEKAVGAGADLPAKMHLYRNKEVLKHAELDFLDACVKEFNIERGDVVSALEVLESLGEDIPEDVDTGLKAASTLWLLDVDQ